MGVVYSARGPEGEHVAIKVLARRTQDAADRFEREERLLEGLGETEGFVRLIATGSSPEGRWFAMPLIRGGTLRERLARGALPVHEVASIGAALARALGHAHARGIIHRDLKPANILFLESGVPLIADLGIAKHYRSDAPGASRSIELSVSGSVRGT